MSPMYWPFLIFAAAIVLFVLEVFIPSGGILGVISFVAVLAAIGSAFAYGGLKMGTLFMAGTALLIPVLMYAMIKLWPKTPFGKRILIQLPGSDEVLPQSRQERRQLIGKRGTAVTPLLPAGAIRVQGRVHDAISDGMSIDKGASVEIIAVRNNAIVVRPSAAPPDETPTEADRNQPFDTVIPDPFDDTLP